VEKHGKSVGTDQEGSLKISSLRWRLTAYALGILILLIGIGIAWSYKTIHLQVDDETATIQVFAWSIDDAIRGTDLPLIAEDKVTLISSDWLAREMTIQIERAAYVVMAADGKTKIFLSASRLPSELLAQAGISLNPGDLLLANGEPVEPDQILPPYGAERKAPVLQVRRQVVFSKSEMGKIDPMHSTAPTVGNALWENGVVLHAADWITPSLDTPLTPGLSLEYIRALPVMIATEGITLTRLSAASRVGEALAQAGLPPQGLDYTIPAENEPLPKDRLIYLVRVREEVQIEQAPVPFETSYQAAPEIDLDQQAVLQAGAYGVTARRIRLRYENGTEVSRSTESEWLVQPPKNQIIGYGTKIVQQTISTDDGIITYWRALRMYAVSYHPGETGGNITASGLEVRKGLAAVDTRYIPLGTQMYVPGYGPALAADTGGGVVGRIIDLAYETDEYVAWHEYVTVYFLWPPPANIVYIIP
jgi:uncharacterized protein YabE (DUF348 family)